MKTYCFLIWNLRLSYEIEILNVNWLYLQLTSWSDELLFHRLSQQKQAQSSPESIFFFFWWLETFCKRKKLLKSNGCQDKARQGTAVCAGSWKNPKEPLSGFSTRSLALKYAWSLPLLPSHNWFCLQLASSHIILTCKLQMKENSSSELSALRKGFSGFKMKLFKHTTGIAILVHEVLQTWKDLLGILVVL